MTNEDIRKKLKDAERALAHAQKLLADMAMSYRLGDSVSTDLARDRLKFFNDAGQDYREYVLTAFGVDEDVPIDVPEEFAPAILAEVEKAAEPELWSYSQTARGVAAYVGREP